jgi:biopolymer transport protein ExbB/TolQ
MSMEGHNDSCATDSNGVYGPRIHDFNILGKIAVVLFTFVVIRFFLFAAGFESPNWFALFLTVCLALSRILWRRWRRQINLRKASELQSKLSELEQIETALRVEEARLSGAFDKWEESKDSGRDTAG